MEEFLDQLSTFSWCFVGLIFLLIVHCFAIMSSYFALKRLKRIKINPSASFSKAAFFEPKARVLWIEYCWIRFERGTGKTTVKHLSIEGEMDEKIVDDSDGSLAQRYAKRLEDERWIRLSSGQLNKEVWESYHQRKNRPL